MHLIGTPFKKADKESNTSYILNKGRFTKVCRSELYVIDTASIIFETGKKVTGENEEKK